MAHCASCHPSVDVRLHGKGCWFWVRVTTSSQGYDMLAYMVVANDVHHSSYQGRRQLVVVKMILFNLIGFVGIIDRN